MEPLDNGQVGNTNSVDCREVVRSQRFVLDTACPLERGCLLLETSIRGGCSTVYGHRKVGILTEACALFRVFTE